MELKDVVDTLVRIENRIIELVTRQAEHNIILQEHKNYSLNLQKQQEKQDLRINPIEKHVHLMTTLLKAIGLVAVGVLIQYFIHKLF